MGEGWTGLPSTFIFSQGSYAPTTKSQDSLGALRYTCIAVYTHAWLACFVRYLDDEKSPLNEDFARSL